MNIKDSYIHNGTAVLKDIKVESSVLKKILAGKDANDAYLDWETVCDLTGIKPTAAGTADKVGHKLTFSGGVTGDWDGSAAKTVAIPTKSSWNYDDVYLKLIGGDLTGTLTIGTNSFGSQLTIWRKEPYYSCITFANGTNKDVLGYIGFTYSGDASVGSILPVWVESDTSKKHKLTYVDTNSTTAVGGTTTPVYVDTNGQIKAGTALGTASTHAHSDYVTSIGTSGNTLTWSKGGTAQTAITIPFATNATYASNVGTAGAAGTNYVTAANVISMYNWYNTITADDAANNTAIDKWNEIISFLAGVTDDKTLSGLLAGKANSTHNHNASDINAGTLGVARGGTGLSTIDIYSVLYASAATTLSALSPNTSATRKFLRMVGDGTNGAAPAWDTVTKTDVGLSNVENTKLSTWAGSANITTLGTVTTGTWSATTIAVNKGGTGKTSWTKNGLIYASDTTTLAQIGVPNGTSTTYWLKAVTNASGVPTYSFSTIGKSDVGLGNVDNTADVNKSVNYANSAGNADTLDNYHVHTLGSYHAGFISQYQSKYWINFLTITIPTVSYNNFWVIDISGSECSQGRYGKLYIALRRHTTTNTNRYINYIDFGYGTYLPQFRLTSDDLVTYHVWVKCSYNTYDPYLYWRVSDYQTYGTFGAGSLALTTNTDPTGTEFTEIATLGGSVFRAAQLAATHSISIAGVSKNFNGTQDLSWSLADLGAAESGHNHNGTYVKVSGDTMTGTLTVPTSYITNNQSRKFIISHPTDNFSDSAIRGSLTYGKSGINGLIEEESRDFGLYLTASNTSDYSRIILSALSGIYLDGTTYINGYTALHSNNYTDYTVTKTGGGANGDWAINVTGNANTADSLYRRSLPGSGYDSADSGKYWHVFTYVAKNGYGGVHGLLSFVDTESTAYSGILNVQFRNNQYKDQVEGGTLSWITYNSKVAAVLTSSIESGVGVTYRLYLKVELAWKTPSVAFIIKYVSDETCFTWNLAKVDSLEGTIVVQAAATSPISISGNANTATTATCVGHSISFKNTANTTVSFDGSNSLDLTGGIYYAATAGSVDWSNVNNKPTVWDITSKTATSYNLSRDSWTDTINLPTDAGSYILCLTTGNSTLTGVFSIGSSDIAKDEISLHLHGNGVRLYARTNNGKLQLSSNYTPTQANPTQSTSVVIKYKRMI